MNPVTYALEQVRFQIPLAILEKTFISNIDRRVLAPLSLNTRIREAVIDARVIPDCNLVGGTQAFISLLNLPVRYIDNFTYVYTIPKDRTQGRRISRALSISYGQGSVMGSTNLGQTNSSPMLDAAAGVMQAQQPLPPVATAYCQMIGENVVMITDNAGLPPDIWLRCWLENDENLNHIQPTSYGEFAKLVVFAVKAYIYVNNQIPMDRAYIMAGAELGAYKNTVDGYSDANQNYEDQKIVWQKVAHFNDFEASNRYHKAISGGLY